MNKLELTLCLIMSFMVGLIVGGIIGLGAPADLDTFRNQAVKHNAAEWISGPDGHPVFHWKELKP